MDQRWSKNPKSVFFGRPFEDVQVHLDSLAKAFRMPQGAKVFLCPRSDLFHEQVPFDFIVQVYGVMSMLPGLTFQILTKRSERMRQFYRWLHETAQAAGMGEVAYCRKAYVGSAHKGVVSDVGPVTWPLGNVWVGVTAEDQSLLQRRLLDLLAVPAVVHWLSLEPLLSAVRLRSVVSPAYMLPAAELAMGPVAGSDEQLVKVDALAGVVKDLSGSVLGRINKVAWVVFGGERGARARPMLEDWAAGIVADCQAADVPVFLKQWGDWLPLSQMPTTMRGEFTVRDQHARVGKHRAGWLLDGQEHMQFPRQGAAGMVVERRGRALERIQRTEQAHECAH